MVRGRISRLSVRDVRFPTSLGGHGADAMHTDPDYSAAYVVIETDAEDGIKGCGITFTLGKGTEVVVCAVNALAHHVLNKDLKDIVGDFRGFYRQLTSDGQLRWIGPEKGVVHLATAAVLNAVWDLWAKQEGKPVWKLLVDMGRIRRTAGLSRGNSLATGTSNSEGPWKVQNVDGAVFSQRSKCWHKDTLLTRHRAPGWGTQMTR
uniref:Enolase superfamily member 1 n=1 Tax=Homo sapiens TaxID=9606 RepID=J3QSB6_HUMAN